MFFVSPYDVVCLWAATTLTGLPVGAGEWFMINANQMFFYRVDYDGNTRNNIVNQLLTNPDVNTILPAYRMSEKTIYCITMISFCSHFSLLLTTELD